MKLPTPLAALAGRFEIPAVMLAAGGFVLYVVRRFVRDRCSQVAGSLAFTSLLALVPLLAVGLAMISAFPVFEQIRDKLQYGIFRILVPDVGDTVEQNLNMFIANTKKLTIFGTAGLAVTAIMVLATIEKAFNQIWRVRRERALSIRLMRFWTALTLGPLLFGLSLTLPGYLFAVAQQVGVDDWLSAISSAALFVPAAAEVIGFTLLYLALPNRQVRPLHAALGGAVAMVLFEMLKFGFALYVISLPTYQTVYGQLSVLPIMLMWIYMAWLVVLTGAVVAAALPAWRRFAAKRNQQPGAG